MSNPHVNSIEITFEDGSSDCIQFFLTGEGDNRQLCDWTRRRNGQRKKGGAYTAVAIATYLYELAYRGERMDSNRMDSPGVALQKAYEAYRAPKP